MYGIFSFVAALPTAINARKTEGSVFVSRVRAIVRRELFACQHENRKISMQLIEVPQLRSCDVAARENILFEIRRRKAPGVAQALSGG